MSVTNDVLSRLEVIANYYKKGVEVALDGFQKSTNEKMKDKFSNDFFFYKEAYQKVKYLETILTNKEFEKNL